jgi:lipoprotein signal peptidase
VTGDARVPQGDRPTREDPRRARRPRRHPGHPRLVLAVLAVVVVLDQATKWWAWRHLQGVFVNRGGDQLVGRKVGTLYSSQLSGAVLDVQSAVVLGLAVWLLVGVHRRLFVVPATMAVAGWISNALDRLGLHFWTAPGSVRGAVDFIPVHGCVYNVADFYIIGGTTFLLGAAGYGLRDRLRGRFTGRFGGHFGARSGGGLSARRRLRLVVAPVIRRPRGGPVSTLGMAAAAAGLVAAVAFGAVHDDGLTSPQAEGDGTNAAATR